MQRTKVDLWRPIGHQLLSIETLLVLQQQRSGSELICPYLIEANPHTQFEGSAQVKRAPDEQSRLASLRCIQPVQRTVVTAATVIGRIRAEAGIAQFLAPERPVDQEPEGGPLRPLPACQFGSPVS